jgi:hypothetical protein
MFVMLFPCCRLRACVFVACMFVVSLLFVRGVSVSESKLFFTERSLHLDWVVRNFSDKGGLVPFGWGKNELRKVVDIFICLKISPKILFKVELEKDLDFRAILRDFVKAAKFLFRLKGISLTLSY